MEAEVNSEMAYSKRINVVYSVLRCVATSYKVFRPCKPYSCELVSRTDGMCDAGWSGLDGAAIGAVGGMVLSVCWSTHGQLSRRFPLPIPPVGPKHQQFPRTFFRLS